MTTDSFVETSAEITAERMWRGRDVVGMTATIIPLAIIPLIIVFVIGFAMAGAFQNPELLQDQDAIMELSTSIGFTLSNLIINAIALTLGVFIIARVRGKFSWDNLWLSNFNARWVLYAVLATIPTMIVVGQITQFAGNLIYDEGFTNWQAELFTGGEFSWVSALLMIPLGGILVPFAEELFFRGILFRWMADKWHPWVGIIVSSIVFGLIHLEPSVAVGTSILGMVMAWFTWKSKSLWPAIVIHVINNAFGLTFMFLSLYFDWGLI